MENSIKKNTKKRINKNTGFTATETLLAELCDKTFLDLWSYPSPYKKHIKGKEMCDLIALFDNDIFIFFIRNSYLKSDSSGNIEDADWKKWKKEVIDKQIKTALGAERYLKQGREIYLDAKNQKQLPITVDIDKMRIHKFIVAHGAAEACKEYFDQNISSSLAMQYSEDNDLEDKKFVIGLSNENPIHVLDSNSLSIVLNELDTFKDFLNYTLEKEKLIKNKRSICYYAEEDLLAYYLMNYDEDKEKHFILPDDMNEQEECMFAEGKWKQFIEGDQYKERNKANEVSYFWDKIIKKVSKHMLDGTIEGHHIDDFNGDHSSKEMAKENRFIRRVLSEGILEIVERHRIPQILGGRAIRLMNSPSPGKCYLFLLVGPPVLPLSKEDYEKYRRFRVQMLMTACGSAKNKSPEFKKIVGITFDPLVDEPIDQQLSVHNIDQCFLDCEEWTQENIDHYNVLNKDFNFFTSEKTSYATSHEFPSGK